MSCEHKSTASWVKIVETVTGEAQMRLGRCTWCHVLVPLGPANDTPESVRAEIRAAELLVVPRGAFATNEAWAGWEAHRRGWEPAPTIDGQAAWLAREIWAQERAEDPCPDGPNCGCNQHANAPDAEDAE